MRSRIPSRVVASALALSLLAVAPAAPGSPNVGEPPVKVSYMYAHKAWQLTLHVEPAVKEIFVALGEGEFASTGFLTAISGDRLAKPMMTIPDVSQTIRVRLLTPEGKQMGPFRFAFDRDKEIVAHFTSALEENRSQWLSFREHPPGAWLVSFSYLAPKTCGIREARYSIDSDALDQVVPLPACNLQEPYSGFPSDYNPYRNLARRPGVVKARILYADGTRSEVVTFRP